MGALQIFTTFTLVAFAWIFFRANNISDAFYIAGHIFSDIPETLKTGKEMFVQDFGMERGEILLSVILIILLEIVHNLQDKINLNNWFYSFPKPARLIFYIIAIISIIYLGKFSDAQFIYFQF